MVFTEILFVASTRRRVDASTRRLVEASTRRRVEASCGAKGFSLDQFPEKERLRSEYAWVPKLQTAQKLRGRPGFLRFWHGFDRKGASYHFQNYGAVEQIFAMPKMLKNFVKNVAKLRAVQAYFLRRTFRGR